MNWKDVGKAVGKFAPLLGTALGVPGAGAIGSLIASAFGVENNPDQIMAALSGDPDAAMKLQAIQNSHTERLEELALQTLTVELADKANARDTHKHNHMPAIICIALTVMVSAGAWMLFNLDIPEANMEISYLLFGTMLAKWGDSISFWVGTTRSSAEKDRRNPER